MNDFEPYLADLLNVLSERKGCREILNMLRQDMAYAEPGSIYHRTVSAIFKVVCDKFRRMSLESFLDVELYPSLKEIARSDKSIQEVIDFIQFLKSDQQFEAMINSVTLSGDQWDENP